MNNKTLGLIGLGVVAYLLLKEKEKECVAITPLSPPVPPIPPTPVLPNVPTPVLGCTNSVAENYDPLATQDDGSCIVNDTPNQVVGCMDPTALNYDPLATLQPDVLDEDGNPLCQYGTTSADTPGCTDVVAQNYNVDATTDDGSCLYTLDCYPNQCISQGVPSPIQPYTDLATNECPTGTSSNPATCGTVPLIPGCTDTLADNYDATAEEDDGSCTYSMNCYPNQCASQGVPMAIQTYSGLSSLTCPQNTGLTQASCGSLPDCPCLDEFGNPIITGKSGGTTTTGGGGTFTPIKTGGNGDPFFFDSGVIGKSGGITTNTNTTTTTLNPGTATPIKTGGMSGFDGDFMFGDY